MKKFLLFLQIVILAEAAWAAPVNPPQGALLPWQVLGMDDVTRGESRAGFEAGFLALRQLWLRDSQDLASWLRQQGVSQTVNAAARSRKFFVGSVTAELLPVPAMVQPWVCGIADHYVLGLELASLPGNLLHSFATAAIPRAHWQKAARENNLDNLMSGWLRELWGKLAGSPPLRESPRDALKVGLALGKETARLDEGSGQCLNLLFSHDLAKRYRVVREIGFQEWVHYREALGQNSEEERATRRLVTIWDFEKQKKLPMTIRLKVQASESVFATPLTTLPEQVFTLTSLLEWAPNPALEALLQQEARALLQAEWPQVAKVDRAWVYLDRGRAWGLKMNDRLISRSGNEVIKGHVVGFYGPKLGLNSPRGFPISEGAIVFIRKGQRGSVIGQEFEFDPTAYPTPWPPEKTP